MIRTLLLASHEIAPYVTQLRALEHDITYPLAGGNERFFIDHGPDYHPFFSELGEAWFLLALDDDRVVGCLTGILRRAHAAQDVATVYLCDFKIAAAHRGGRVARAMAFEALRRAATERRFRQWRYAYGAAMHGARGDVMRSARGLHPARLFAPAARLRLFFVPAQTLAELDTRGCPPAPRSAGLDLSPDVQRADPLGVISTAGRKDLRLASSGVAWPLIHLGLGPRAWPGNWAEYLRAAGQVAADRPGVCCFALDARLADHLGWARTRGLHSDTLCTVYAWRLPGGPAKPAWIHLSPSEI